MVLAISIIGVLILFTILVVAHEFGHFLSARREGVIVDEFGVGFPPRVFGRKRGGTLYSINALPIGGFVRLRGEDGQDKGKGSFAKLSFWPKTRIIMAGVVVNFLIAYLLFTLLLIIGIPPLGQPLPEFGPIKPQKDPSGNLIVMSVANNSAATRAGIKQGDSLLAIGDQAITSNEGLREFTRSNAGQTVVVKVNHGGKNESKTVVLGTDEQAGILGITADQMTLSKYSWWAAPIAALVMMFQFVVATLAAFGNLIIGLFSRGKVGAEVSGPIGAVSIFSQIMNFGPRYIILFVASISLSLAVINALPLPALDGGRQFILILQKYGVKITPERENMIHIAGFVGLLILMVVISISDIARLR